MKKLLTIFAVALSAVGIATAGCGVKIPVSGELKSYEAEKKQITVGDKAITLAATVKVTDAEGEEAKLEDLVGKTVTVSTDKHNKKGESVTVAKKKG